MDPQNSSTGEVDRAEAARMLALDGAEAHRFTEELIALTSDL